MADALVLAGIHHITAVTARAPENLRFCTRVLGLRLVKKTVNQDDVSAYHLFCADRVGTPGTEVTFFDWPHLPPHQPGHGEIARMALRVGSRQALDWWLAWLDGHGVPGLERGSYAGRDALFFTDFEGQRLALVDDGGVPGGVPWERSPVPPEYQVKGIFAVTLVVRALEPTARVLVDVLGFRLRAEGAVPLARHCSRRDRAVPGRSSSSRSVRTCRGPSSVPVVSTTSPSAYRTMRRIVPGASRSRRRAFRSRRRSIASTSARSIFASREGCCTSSRPTDQASRSTRTSSISARSSLPPFLEPRRAEIEAHLRPLEPVEAENR